MGTTKFSNKVGPSIVLWELTNKTQVINWFQMIYIYSCIVYPFIKKTIHLISFNYVG